jgi:pentatricopeptide repeat protein
MEAAMQGILDALACTEARLTEALAGRCGEQSACERNSSFDGFAPPSSVVNAQYRDEQTATVLAFLGSDEMSSSTTLLAGSVSDRYIPPLYDDDRYTTPQPFVDTLANPDDDLLQELAACEKRLIACIEGVPAKCSVNCQNAFGGFTAPATEHIIVDKMSSTKPSLTTSTTIYGAPVFDQYCDADLGDNAMELVDIERIDLLSGTLAGCYGEQSARGHTPSSFNDDLGASLASVANSSIHGGHGSVLPHLTPICAGTSRISVPEDRRLDCAEDFDTNHLDKGCILFGGVRASREEVAQARCDNTKLVIKQALAEASTAKDSLELTGGDNTHFNGVHRGQPFETLSNPSADHRLLHASVDNVCLNDAVADRESALQNLRLEYECVRVSEVTAQGRLKELNSILAATTTATACSTPTSTKCSMQVLNHDAYSVPNLPVVCIVGGSNFPNLRGFEAICTSTARPRSSRRSTSSSSIAQQHPQAGAVGSSESELAAPSSVPDDSVALIAFSGRCDYARANEMTSAQIDAMAQDETDEIANANIVEQLTGLGVEKVVAAYKFRDPKTSDQEMLESICGVLMPLKLQAKIAKAKFEAACSGKISCADIVAFTASDASYFLSNDGINFNRALNLFKEMKATGVKPNLVMCNTMLYVMGHALQPWVVKSIHREMIDKQVQHSKVTYCCLLHAYTRAHYDEDAMAVYRLMKDEAMDVMLYNMLLSRYVDIGYVDEAEEIFRDMKASMDDRSKPDKWSYSSMLRQYSSTANVLGVEGILNEMVEELGKVISCVETDNHQLGSIVKPLVHDLADLAGLAHSGGFKQPWPPPMEFECLDCAWSPATWRSWSAAWGQAAF